MLARERALETWDGNECVGETENLKSLGPWTLQAGRCSHLPLDRERKVLWLGERAVAP